MDAMMVFFIICMKMFVLIISEERFMNINNFDSVNCKITDPGFNRIT